LRRRIGRDRNVTENFGLLVMPQQQRHRDHAAEHPTRDGTAYVRYQRARMRRDRVPDVVAKCRKSSGGPMYEMRGVPNECMAVRH
jgi:hypothetical protein